MPNVITPECRLSFVRVKEPAPTPSGALKYSVQLIWEKEDDLKIVEEAVQKAAEDKFDKKIFANGWPHKVLMNPLRDGEEERPGDPQYVGKIFASAKSDRQPGVVIKKGDKIVPLMDFEEIYSGCYGRVSISVYAYDKAGNKGVAFGLNNIMKTRDGDRLDGRTAAQDDFAQFGEFEQLGELEELDDNIPF